MIARSFSIVSVSLVMLLAASAAHGQARMPAAPIPDPAARLDVRPSDVAAPPALGRLEQFHLPERAVAASPSRNVRYTILGAALGAAVGGAVLFSRAECRTAESMCGLSIPLYSGSGAAAGGLIGYLIATARR